MWKTKGNFLEQIKKFVWMLMASPQKNLGNLMTIPLLHISSTACIAPRPKSYWLQLFSNSLPTKQYCPQQSERLKPPSTTNLNLIKPTHHLFIKHENPIKGPKLTPTTKTKSRSAAQPNTQKKFIHQLVHPHPKSPFACVS